MSKSLINQSFIDKYKYESEIIKQTAEQVIKDFAMFGIDISFSGNTNFAYDELYDQLNFQIEKLLKNNYPKLQSLLYQVDIHPKKLKKNDKLKAEEELITEAILDREFQKVLTRLYFKLNPDKL
ncbi:hypothetical protein ACFLTE_08305 [Bacteroidota bacterium]